MRSRLAATLGLTVALAVGACGGGGTHRASTGSAPSPTTTTAPAPTASAGAASASDLKAVDDGMSQLDQQLGAADQGLNGSEPDPTQ